MDIEQEPMSECLEDSNIVFCRQQIIIEEVTFPEGVKIRDPRGMFAKPNGEILVIDSGYTSLNQNHHLRVIKDMIVQSEAIGIPNTKLQRPIGLCVNKDDQILIANTHFNSVVLIGEEKDKVILGPNTLKGPRGITTDKLGNVFICDSENNRILKYSTKGEVSVVNCGNQPTPFNLPTGLCLLDSGEVIVANCEANCIQKIDLEGNVKVICGTPDTPGYKDTEPTQCSWPYNIARLGNNLLFVEAKNNSLRVILKSGKVVSLDVRPHALGKAVSYMRGLTITKDYDIYVSGIDNCIFRIRPKPNYPLALMIFQIYNNDNFFQFLPKELIFEIIKYACTYWEF